MAGREEFHRALAEGARRSRRVNAPPPTAGDALSPRRAAEAAAALWRRFKWPLIGLGLFLLIEIFGLASISGARGHF